MKKFLITLACVIVLTGCDSANQMIDKAQDAANQKAVELQNKLEAVDINGLNLELLKNSPQLASQLSASINDALTVDFTSPEAMTAVKNKIANAYSCLAEASSATTAQEVMDKLLANINNSDVKTLIDSGVQKAQSYQSCVK